jgi:glycosyltransferase involved in cell wall biosynthesis
MPISTTVPYYLSTEFSRTHQVHIICPKEYENEDRNQDGNIDNIHRINVGKIPILSPILFLIYSTIYAPILSIRYGFDSIYSFQMTLLQGWLSSCVSKARFIVGLQSVPVRQGRNLSNEEGNDDRDIRKQINMFFLSLYQQFASYFIEQSTETICLTEGIRTKTEEIYEISLTDAHIIGMGVDTQKFEICHDEHTKTDPWVVTYIGSIRPIRGFEHVLEAVSASEHDIRFQIAGDGPVRYINKISKKANRLGIQESVNWLGVVPHDEIPELLKESDIAISPLPDVESYRISFPAKLLEYMAAGSLVIATDIPPHSNIIDDNMTGYLYDGTQMDLVETFNRCIQNPENHTLIRQQARETATNHDWENIINRYEEVVF